MLDRVHLPACFRCDNRLTSLGLGLGAYAVGRIRSGPSSHFPLLRDLERVVRLNAEVPDGAFQLRVVK